MEGLEQRNNGADGQEMYGEILTTLKSGKAWELGKLKKKYLEKYFNDPEWVEAAFGLREVLQKQQAIAKERKSGYAIAKERFKDLTEYEFLFTNFLLNNGKRKDFLQEFLNICRSIAEFYKMTDEMNIFWSGIRSQAAVYKILEKIGTGPRLAKPSEDAYEKIDLWVEGNKAIQSKGGRSFLEPAVISTRHFAFPAVSTNGGSKFFNSAEYLESDARSFLASVDKYGKAQGKEIKGYMLMVPSSKIDFVTGEPSHDLVEFFKKELGKQS